MTSLQQLHMRGNGFLHFRALNFFSSYLFIPGAGGQGREGGGEED